MGGKDLSQRTDNVLNRLLEAERQHTEPKEEQPIPEQKDDFRWDEYKQRQRDFEDIRIARLAAADEAQRREELRSNK